MMLMTPPTALKPEQRRVWAFHDLDLADRV